MSFTDWYFYPAVIGLIFLLIFIQFAMKERKALANRFMKAVLLGFSYLSMWLYDYRFCLCITVVILITYYGALKLEGLDERRKKYLTVMVVVLLLGMLGIFKYLNFFMSTVMRVAGREWNSLKVILPIGISFYIFSAVGYVLDVSWGYVRAEKSLLDIALFLSFFPKLICGPIVAGRDFLPQLKEQRRVTAANVKIGIQVFVFGLFKKAVLADHLGIFVDDVFGAVPAYDTLSIWMAVFSSFLQLYFDFSGYSDMAIGTARILGYEIGRNFNVPFAAKNISEFWDRWHISLTNWLNEYVFNPIAIQLKRVVSSWTKGRRKRYRMLPTCTALLITFLVSGLWHGAGFTFIVWGLCHGIYSIFHVVYANWMRRHHREFEEHKGRLVVVVDVLANYLFLNLIQVFFRADSLGQAFTIFRFMFSIHQGIHQLYVWTFLAYILLATATIAAYRRTEGKVIVGFYPLQDLDTFRGRTVFLAFCELTFLFAYMGETFFAYANF